MMPFIIVLRCFCTVEEVVRAVCFLYEKSQKITREERTHVRFLIDEFNEGLVPDPDIITWLASRLVAEELSEVTEAGYRMYLSLTGYPICITNTVLRQREKDDDLYGEHEVLYSETRIFTAQMGEIPLKASERMAKTKPFNNLARECLNYLDEHLEVFTHRNSLFEAVEQVGKMIV